MPVMPRIGGSHTFEELEEIARKNEAAQKAVPASPPAPSPAEPEDPAQE